MAHAHDAPGPERAVIADGGPGPAMPFVGRAAQLASLHEAFARVRAGQAVVCHVCGRSGVGKSALIDRFVSELDSRASTVLRERCSERESAPYNAVDGLIEALLRHLVTLPEAELTPLAPPHPADLGRAFPILRRVDELFRGHDGGVVGTPVEVRRRAVEALRALLDNVARRRPLVLCIDDLQWGDTDSAALLTGLFRPPDAPPVLLLLAYRSEDFDRSACLQALAESGLAGLAAQRIGVPALSPGDAGAVSGSAVDERGPAHDASSGGAIGPGDDLMSAAWQRLAEFPEATRRLVHAVAVAGVPIRLGDALNAAWLTGPDPQALASLQLARLVRTTGASRHDWIEPFDDRARDSICARLEPETIRGYHERLAASLQASGLAEPGRLAAHVEGAGDLARASLLYGQAAAEAAHVLAFDGAEALLARAIALAPGDAERTRLQEQLIHFYVGIGRDEAAYAVGRQAVQAYGTSLPASFASLQFLADVVAVRVALRGRSPAQLLDLPEMRDERMRQLVRLLHAVARAAGQIRPQLYVAVALKIVRLCLRHGNTEDAALGYVVFGCIVEAGLLGHHRAGYDFGRLGLRLVDKYESERQRGQVQFVAGYFGTAWIRPAPSAEELWRKAIADGVHSGDLLPAGYACAGLAMSLFMRGVPMARLWQETGSFLDVLERHRLDEPRDVVLAIRQGILNLQGKTWSRTSLDSTGFSEHDLSGRVTGFGARHFAHFYLVLKLQLLYMWGEYAAAAAMARRSTTYLGDSPGLLHAAEHHFYAGLTAAAHPPLRREVGRSLRRFRRWAENCPANFLHKMYVLEGEAARLAGRLDEALAAYEAAERSALQYGYLQVEALAVQLAARVFDATGRTADGADARARAAAAYRTWGASAYAEFVAGRENRDQAS